MYFIRNRAECGRCHVVCTGVRIHDATNAAEDNNFGYCDAPKCFGKILGVLHLCNETWECNLSDESVADVHESVHPGDKGSA